MIEAKVGTGLKFDNFDAINFAIYVDGQLTHQPLTVKEHYEVANACVHQSEGPKIYLGSGQWKVRKYRFRTLCLNDNTKAATLTDCSKIGLIEMVVHYAKRVKNAVPEIQQMYLSKLQRSEKDVKGRATDTVTT